MSGTYPAHIPRVKTVSAAGPEAVTLTLESGEQVTVKANSGTSLLNHELLLADWRNEGPAYILPPALAWEAATRLDLWNNPAHREIDAHLLSLPSITEVDTSGRVLTLAFIHADGKPGVQRFTGKLAVQFTRHEPGEDFTRFPFTLTVQEGQGKRSKFYVFRVDHTSAGYAALTALGWDTPLPALEDVRPVSLSEAAD